MKMIIVFFVVLVFLCTACSQDNVTNMGKIETSNTTSKSTKADDGNNSDFKEIEFGNKDEIILKTGTIHGIENGMLAAVIGRDDDNIYCLNSSKHYSVDTYRLDNNNLTANSLKTVMKAVNDKRVIKVACMTGDWIIWEEDEDEIIYDWSYGKNWAMYARNMKSGELIEIDREKDIKVPEKTVIIYTAPQSIEASDGRFVYTVYDILEDGNTYAVIKMYDLSQRKGYILDSVKDYYKGFYSYPDIDGDNVVWSYSVCNERFNGDERGYTYLYNIKTKEKKQISYRDDILWPTIYKNYIAARVKPNGLNENSEIVLYDMNGDRKWRTVVSPQSEMYADYTHMEIMLPRFCNKYLTWGDNINRDFTIFDVEHKKYYKLYEYDKSNNDSENETPESFRFSVRADKFITWCEFYLNIKEDRMQYDYKYVLLK